MKLFCIVNMADGSKLPVGGSRAEFSRTKAPRLFSRKADAANALACWRLGHWTFSVDEYGDTEGPEPSEIGSNLKRRAERQAMDLRIGECRLETRVEP